MTQGTGNRPTKRALRAGRYKPTLVTTPETEAGEEQQEAVQEVEETTPVEETPTEVAAPTTRRRLPRFFSTVGKSEQEQEVSEETVVQARLARATRGKTAKTETAQAADDEEEAAEPERKAAAPARTTPARNAPARPASPFKMKYIIGMVVYLLGAQLIGSLEVNLFTSYKIDSTLAAFNLFGLPIVVKTSTLVFLVILVVLLVILAKLDLIPRSLSAFTGQPPQKRGSTSSRQRDNGNEVVRTPQPTIRQGVSGADDDLYQQYRSNQRRKKN
jgi:hypothetical protein